MRMKLRTKVTKTKKRRPKREKIEMGSGNVFADLGLEDSEQLLLKAELASRITQLIEKKGWTQAQTAETNSFGSTESLSPLARPALWFFSRSSLRDP